MEMGKKKLPIGIENFEKLRSDDFYYIDKTGLIRELLNNWGEVNLFTRPRRFGKTLNMSMLEHFFSMNGDKRIFDGLNISRETALCEEYMGKYPVISVSLKGIDARVYETAYQMAAQIIIEARQAFLGRLDDISQDGMVLIEDIVEIFDTHGIDTEMIAASIRHPVHVLEAAKAGAHIATIPYATIMQMIKHPLTTAGIERFLKDWETVPKK